jgi:hypothetical protein
MSDIQYVYPLIHNNAWNGRYVTIRRLLYPLPITMPVRGP